MPLRRKQHGGRGKKLSSGRNPWEERSAKGKANEPTKDGNADSDIIVEDSSETEAAIPEDAPLSSPLPEVAPPVQPEIVTGSLSNQSKDEEHKPDDVNDSNEQKEDDKATKSISFNTSAPTFVPLTKIPSAEIEDAVKQDHRNNCPRVGQAADHARASQSNENLANQNCGSRQHPYRDRNYPRDGYHPHQEYRRESYKDRLYQDRWFDSRRDRQPQPMRTERERRPSLRSGRGEWQQRMEHKDWHLPQKMPESPKEKLPVTTIPRSPITIQVSEKSIEPPKPREYLEIGRTIQLPKQNLCQAEAAFELLVPKNYVLVSAKKRYTDSLEVLAYYVDPRERTAAPELTLDKLLAAAVHYRCNVEAHADAIDIEMVPPVKQEILKYWKLLNALKYANKGFLAEKYLKDFSESFLSVDWKEELKKIEDFANKLCSSTLNCSEFEEEFDKEKQLDDDIMNFIEEDKRQELEQMNIYYAATPLIRLTHDAPVTAAEIYDIVRESVTSDYGYFLWLAENKPECLLKRADIADCVISTINGKLSSKDHRPLACLISLGPQMLQSLTPEEKEALAEKYIVDENVKVGNWPEILLQGYKMRRFKEIDSKKEYERAAKEQVRSTTCVTTAKMLEAEKPEDIVDYLFFCSLIAELGEGRFSAVFDHSTDSFCTRIARIICHDHPREKRKLLLEALMLLPQSIKARLLAEGDHPTKTSLYSSAEQLIVAKELDLSKTYDSIQLLSPHISLVRMVSTSIIPNMENVELRPRVASVLREIIKIAKFKEEMLESTELSPAVLCKLAIGQYAEPEPDKPSARYSFIEQILLFVDSILAEDTTEQIVLDDIDTIISDQNLTWQQHLAIFEVCFPKSKAKLKQPEMPSIQNDFSSLKSAKFVAILYSWPLQNTSSKLLMAPFEETLKEIIPRVDSAKLAYVLLTSTLGGGTKTEKYKQNVADFVRDILTPKATFGEISDEKQENTQVWLKEFLGDREVHRDVRNIVIGVARRIKQYERTIPNSNNRPRNAEKSMSRDNVAQCPNNERKENAGREGGRDDGHRGGRGGDRGRGGGPGRGGGRNNRKRRSQKP